MAGHWSLLTNHAWVLVCIARDPSLRLREIAELVGITERSAHSIVTDLAESGYVLKEREGRRNHYQVQRDRALPAPGAEGRTVGEFLDLVIHPRRGRRSQKRRR
jgi:predicted transcriptional regulator